MHHNISTGCGLIYQVVPEVLWGPALQRLGIPSHPFLLVDLDTHTHGLVDPTCSAGGVHLIRCRCSPLSPG